MAVPKPTRLFMDNQSAVSVAKNQKICKNVRQLHHCHLQSFFVTLNQLIHNTIILTPKICKNVSQLLPQSFLFTSN